MNVVSLFNGHSGGNISLDAAGIKYKNYFSSEVDKYALKIEKHLYPQNIQMGDVRNIYYSNGVLVTDNGVFDIGKVGFFIGGSPCQSFSFAGKSNGMTTIENIEIITLEQYLILKSENFQFEGYSYLFWEYMRILEEIKVDNPDVLFLLENVKMNKGWNIVINDALGVEAVLINSSLVSAQSRKRLYWTNIEGSELTLFGNCISQPKNKGLRLRDILEDQVNEKYYLSNKAIQGLDRRQLDSKKRGHGFGYNLEDGNSISKTILKRYGNDGKECLIKVDVAEACRITGRNPDNPKSRESGLPTVQMLEVNKDPDISNCLTTVQKDTVILETSSFKVRRLTPRECGRL